VVSTGTQSCSHVGFGPRSGRQNKEIQGEELWTRGYPSADWLKERECQGNEQSAHAVAIDNLDKNREGTVDWEVSTHKHRGLPDSWFIDITRDMMVPSILVRQRTTGNGAGADVG
jgi:hypothetical protein